jgi:hypothetical protein
MFSVITKKIFYRKIVLHVFMNPIQIEGTRTISYQCVPCHKWCTHRTSLVVNKKYFFSYLVAVNNSIKVGPLVLLL